MEHVEVGEHACLCLFPGSPLVCQGCSHEVASIHPFGRFREKGRLSETRQSLYLNHLVLKIVGFSRQLKCSSLLKNSIAELYEAEKHQKPRSKEAHM